jgi:hypothetical protein
VRRNRDSSGFAVWLFPTRGAKSRLCMIPIEILLNRFVYRGAVQQMFAAACGPEKKSTANTERPCVLFVVCV